MRRNVSRSDAARGNVYQIGDVVERVGLSL